MLAAWLLSGVAVGEVLRVAAFELLYVLTPGCLFYLLLSPVPGGRLRTVAIGWPLGYAIEVGAFALTAAVHARGAFTLLPVVSVAAAGPLLLRRRGRTRLGALLRGSGRHPERTSAERPADPAPARPRAGAEMAVVAVAVATAVVVLAFTFYAPAPLPAHAGSVAYREDNVFDISIAADARNHWPITEPWVAGQPLRYYTAVFVHVAAVNQVAGVPLATVILRLLPAIMFMVVALQLWALGRTVGRSPWIGPLAAVLLLVTADVNLAPTRSQVFHIGPFTQFPLSPTFALGAPFLLGAILLLQTHVARPASGDPGGAVAGARPGSDPRVLAMLAVLVLGTAAAKTFAAADLLGGLGLYWLWSLATRRATRELTYCLAAAAVCVAVAYFVMLAGGAADSVGIQPLSFLREADTLQRATSVAKELGGSVLYLPLLVVGGAALAVVLLAPLGGAAWALYRHPHAQATVALPWAVFATGVLGYVSIGALGGVEGVFLVYGYIALLPVAAGGLVSLWEETPAPARALAVRAWAATLALAVGLATVTAAVSLHGHVLQAWLAVGYGALALALAWTTRRLGRHYRPAVPARAGRVAACCIPVVAVLGVVKPTILAGTGAWKTILGRPTSIADSPGEYGMTAALYRGLRWVRAHTSPCAVLAVNNHYSNAGPAASLYFYYSAFAERRVYLESWQYTPGGESGGLPFPARLRLSNLATQRGDPAALRQLARDGVGYVLIDKTHGGGAPEPPSVSRLVYDNAALDVYRLLPVAGAGARGCATVT